MQNVAGIGRKIEQVNKKMVWPPVKVGIRHGRECYSISFTDGSEEEFYIDYENKEIERVEA